jgi:hypothetical protein
MNDDGPGRVRLHHEHYQRPGISEWSCGHTAGAVCAECYRRLANKANELAEEVQALRDQVAECETIIQRMEGVIK